MYSNDSNPAWYRDVKWIATILLVFLFATLTLLISFAQLTRPRLGQSMLESVLSLSLLPDNTQADAAPAIEIAQGLDFTPGEPLILLPGVNISAETAELTDFTPDLSRARIAAAFTDDIVTSGLATALGRVTDPQLQAQLERLAQDTLPPLVKGLLETYLFPAPAELGTGTRLADWPLQAQQRPGRDVQPMVGVFVTAPPALLETLNPRQIGEYVVNQLGLTLIDQGLGAALELISRETVRTLFTQSVQEDVRPELNEVFNTLLIAQDKVIQERLDEARQIIAALNAPEALQEEGVQGITPASALVGLSVEEANRVVIRDMASVMYKDGVDATLRLMTDANQKTKVERSAGLLGFFTSSQNSWLVRNSYFVGFASLIILVIFLFASAGWERLWGLGGIMVVAAAPGLLSLNAYTQNLFSVDNLSLPAAPPASGIPSYLRDIFAYTLQRLPEEAFPLLMRNHLVTLAAGIILILLTLTIMIFRTFGGNNRDRF